VIGIHWEPSISATANRHTKTGQGRERSFADGATGHFPSLKHPEDRAANDRFRLGLFDTCPCGALTLRRM